FGLSGTFTILSRGSQAAVESQMVGTFPWMAPELVDKDPKVGRKCDIYSFAVTMWEIASRSIPFKGYPYPAMIGVLALTQNMRENIPDDTPEEFSKLIQDCWSAKPDDRPSAIQIVQQINHIRATTDYFKGSKDRPTKD